MSAAVLMLIICWVPEGGALKEAWRIEKEATVERCLIMNRVLAGGGQAGAITVKCGKPPGADDQRSVP